jgi:hypothetical protein
MVVTGGKLKCTEENLSRCHSAYHTFRTHWPGTEPSLYRHFLTTNRPSHCKAQFFNIRPCLQALYQRHTTRPASDMQSGLTF